MNIRELDGEPHEVAYVAGTQAEAALHKALAAFKDFTWAARGAWLSAEDVRTGTMPSGEDFEASPLGAILANHESALNAVAVALPALTRSAGWNPKAP